MDLALPRLDWEPRRKTKRQRWGKVKRSVPGAPLKARPAGRRARSHPAFRGVAALTSAQRNRPQSKHAPRGCGRRLCGRVGPISAGAPPNLPPAGPILPRATWKRARVEEPGRAERTTPPAAPAARAIVPAPPPPRARSREGVTSGGRRRPLAPRHPPAHSPGRAANGDREARSGERRRPAVATAAT